MSAGWICLHRELMDKPVWFNSSPIQKTILITLLFMANHKPKQWEWQGKKFICERGQMITSLPSLAEKCGSGVSIQNIRTSLKRFESLGFLTDESTKQGRLITICNYDKYQNAEDDVNRPTNSQLTVDQQTPNSQLTANNNETIKQINSPIAHARNSEGISKQPLPASAIPANPPSGFSVVEMTNDWEPDQQTIEHVTRGTGITRQEITSSLPAFRAHHLAAKQTEFNFCKKLVSWCLRERQYEKNRSPPQAAASSNGITKAELDELYARHCGDQAT